MKKLILAIASILVSMHVQAATPPNSNTESHEIVTPDIATSFYRTEKYTYDKDMNILICPMNMKYERSMVNGNKNCNDSKSEANNQWVKMEKISRI